MSNFILSGRIVIIFLLNVLYSDNRFFLKQMSAREVQSFTEFAPMYIQHINQCYANQVPYKIFRITHVNFFYSFMKMGKMVQLKTITNDGKKIFFFISQSIFSGFSYFIKMFAKTSQMTSTLAKIVGVYRIEIEKLTNTKAPASVCEELLVIENLFCNQSLNQVS